MIFRRTLFGLANMVLAACVFNVEPEPAGNDSSRWGGLTPGFYHSRNVTTFDYSYESEMILDSNGRFRFTVIVDSTPQNVTRGTWDVSGGSMIWKSLTASFPHSEFNFDNWQNFSQEDTSLIRAVTSESFQRLETWFDPESYGYYKWFTYHRVPPLPKLSVGRYEYSEINRDPVDTARIVSALNWLELTPDGQYRDGRIEDGKPVYEFKADHWFQSGSFLITQGDSSRQYVDSTQSFTPWAGFPTEEYVVHLRNIQPDSFQQWLPFELTYQPEAYWVTWRRRNEP